jgi:hypothetical protein
MLDFKNDNGFHTSVFDSGAYLCALYGGFGMPTVAILAGPAHDVIYSNVGFVTADTAYAGTAIRDYFSGVGIEEQNELSGWNVYPNPASAKINVEFTLASPSNVNIQIVDLSGRLVTEIFPNEKLTGEFKKEFDVHSIAAGSYLLKTTVNNKSSFEKIRISR